MGTSRVYVSVHVYIYIYVYSTDGTFTTSYKITSCAVRVIFVPLVLVKTIYRPAFESICNYVSVMYMTTAI